MPVLPWPHLVLLRVGQRRVHGVDAPPARQQGAGQGDGHLGVVWRGGEGGGLGDRAVWERSGGQTGRRKGAGLAAKRCGGMGMRGDRRTARAALGWGQGRLGLGLQQARLQVQAYLNLMLLSL